MMMSEAHRGRFAAGAEGEGDKDPPDRPYNPIVSVFLHTMFATCLHNLRNDPGCAAMTLLLIESIEWNSVY